MFKSTVIFILFCVLTFYCINIPVETIATANTPMQITVGPHQTYQWGSGYILTSQEGTYSVKSNYRYFEVSQGETVKTSALEQPEVGENTGKYWIRNYAMTGDWTISSSAEIFSAKMSSFVVTPTEITKSSNALIIIIASFTVWILGIGLLVQISKL